MKSTVSLSREQAEEKFLEIALRVETDLIKRILRNWICGMSNGVLEAKLEELNDADKGGEGFENYDIT